MADRNMPSRGNPGDPARTVATVGTTGSNRSQGQGVTIGAPAPTAQVPPGWASGPLYIPGQENWTPQAFRPKAGDVSNPWALDSAGDPEVDTTNRSDSDGPLYGTDNPFAILADFAMRGFPNEEENPQTTYVPVMGSGSSGGGSMAMVLLIVAALGGAYYYFVYRKKGGASA